VLILKEIEFRAWEMGISGEKTVPAQGAWWYEEVESSARVGSLDRRFIVARTKPREKR
jgi:hypothetical protein